MCSTYPSDPPERSTQSFFPSRVRSQSNTYSNPTGGMDFGQLLNYLAPAAVTWWLETDFYSSEAMGKSRKTPGEDQSREKGGRDG